MGLPGLLANVPTSRRNSGNAAVSCTRTIHPSTVVSDPPGFEENHGTGLAFPGTSATNKEYRQIPCAIAPSHPTRACHRRQSRTRRRPKDATQSTTGRMRKGAPSWIAKATRSYSPNRSQTKTPMPKMTLATNIITIAEVKTSAKRYRTIESGTVDRSFLRGEGRRSRRTSGPKRDHESRGEPEGHERRIETDDKGRDASEWDAHASNDFVEAVHGDASQ